MKGKLDTICSGISWILLIIGFYYLMAYAFDGENLGIMLLIFLLSLHFYLLSKFAELLLEMLRKIDSKE